MSPSLETFLLCSAALANLTTLCPAALPVVTDAALVAVLLGHPAAAARSVYILEQLVTVLVNLAKLPHARNQMTHVSRAANGPSRNFTVPREGPYQGLLLELCVLLKFLLSGSC